MSKLDDLDVWNAKGANGLISLMAKRLLSDKRELSPEVIKKFEINVTRLEDELNKFKTFETGEINQESWDILWIECLGHLILTLEERIFGGPKLNGSDSLVIYQNNLTKLKELLAGAQKKESRARNPGDQGKYDANTGWPDRSEEIYLIEQDKLKYKIEYGRARAELQIRSLEKELQK